MLDVPSRRRGWALIAHLLGVFLLIITLAACIPMPSPGLGPERVVRVVAGENFWASIAAQLGGAHASVTSVVSDPNADPHEYEATPRDARALAEARYVILNGAGFDSWGQRLLEANPVSGRAVLVVADILGKSQSDNPHFWYSPDYVMRVADRITSDYQRLDPADADYFTQQRAAFEVALRPYHERIAAIKARFSGQSIGATENIFVYMADALGLTIASPPAFMRAAAEGIEPPPTAIVEFQRQITDKRIAVLVYNVQTESRIADNMRRLARQYDIPMVGISETMQPLGATFQDWQEAQLVALHSALSKQAPGR